MILLMNLGDLPRSPYPHKGVEVRVSVGICIYCIYIYRNVCLMRTEQWSKQNCVQMPCN